ncbi:hypothetical protein MRX96_014695 [Rhipicephalus microplus]
MACFQAGFLPKANSSHLHRATTTVWDQRHLCSSARLTQGHPPSSDNCESDCPGHFLSKGKTLLSDDGGAAVHRVGHPQFSPKSSSSEVHRDAGTPKPCPPGRQCGKQVGAHLPGRGVKLIWRTSRPSIPGRSLQYPGSSSRTRGAPAYSTTSPVMMRVYGSDFCPEATSSYPRKTLDAPVELFQVSPSLEGSDDGSRWTTHMSLGILPGLVEKLTTRKCPGNGGWFFRVSGGFVLTLIFVGVL